MADQAHRLHQLEARKEFVKLGTEVWTTVYRSPDDMMNGTAVFSAFAPKAYRVKALAHNSFDLSPGDGHPGFMQSYQGNRARTTYLRFGNDDGLEPIVIVQTFHGVKDKQVRISEEFQLYHNLWVDPKTSRHVKIADDGSELIAAEVTPTEVRIRTGLLRQFQAARQLVSFCSWTPRPS